MLAVVAQIRISPLLIHTLGDKGSVIGHVRIGRYLMSGSVAYSTAKRERVLRVVEYCIHMFRQVCQILYDADPAVRAEIVNNWSELYPDAQPLN